MTAEFLVPDQVVTADGTGPPLEAPGEFLLLTLGVEEVVEQESLEVMVYGSADGSTWSAKPLLAMPQKFYRSVSRYAIALDQHPDVRWLQARWKVARWGRGSLKPRFRFYVTVQAG